MREDLVGSEYQKFWTEKMRFPAMSLGKGRSWQVIAAQVGQKGTFDVSSETNERH